jgi:hypothetical protein
MSNTIVNQHNPQQDLNLIVLAVREPASELKNIRDQATLCMGCGDHASDTCVLVSN